MTVCLINVDHLDREDKGSERERESQKERERAEGKLGEILS